VAQCGKAAPVHIDVDCRLRNSGMSVAPGIDAGRFTAIGVVSALALAPPVPLQRRPVWTLNAAFMESREYCRAAVT
jgi:hypothetical protein